jgi:ATP-dependent DNA ligase
MRNYWPMGCSKLDTGNKQDIILSTPYYIAQEKLDGVRGIMTIDEAGRLRITTRGYTYNNPDEPIEITHRLPDIAKYTFVGLANTVLDGEFMSAFLSSSEVAGILGYRSTVPTEPSIFFHCFDVLQIKGCSLIDSPLYKRLIVLEKLEAAILQSGVNNIKVVPYVKDKKREFMRQIFEKGGEGIVLKNLYSTYYEGKKKANTWYKIKKRDNEDVVIIGSTPPEQYYRDPVNGDFHYDRITKPWANGWIGSIDFKYGNKTGSCSGISDELRASLSNGNHRIKPEYIGRIMEIEYMELTKDGNFRHPRFVRIRETIEKAVDK